MPGLVPGIHVLESPHRETWMAGTSPAMTRTPSHDRRHRCEADRTGAKIVRRRLAVLLGLALDRDLAADGRHRGRLRRPLQCRQILADQRADRAQRAGADLAYAGPHPGTDFLRRPGQDRVT